MEEHKFLVDGDTLSHMECDSESLKSGGIGSYSLKFDFTNGEQGLNWFCTFKRNGCKEIVELKNRSCEIPSRILERPGGLFVGVFGTTLNIDSPKRITTNFVEMYIDAGAYSGPAPKEHDLWEKCYAEIVGLTHNIVDGEPDGSIQNVFSEVGSMTFTVLDIDADTKTYTLDSVEGLAVGDKYYAHLLYTDTNGNTASLQNNEKQNGYITKINGNVVEVDNFFDIPAGATFKPITTEADYVANGIDTEVNTFRVPAKPDVGTRLIGDLGVALGFACRVLSKCGMAINSDNTVIGSHGFAANKDNIAGYAARANGKGNKSLGQCSATDGQSNEAIGNQSDAGGLGTKAKGHKSMTRGVGTIATAEAQFARGRYNAEDADEIYYDIVGNGKSDKNRKNAYTLHKDGIGWFANGIKIGGAGQNDENSKWVASEEYVDSSIKTAILDSWEAAI